MAVVVIKVAQTIVGKNLVIVHAHPEQIFITGACHYLNDGFRRAILHAHTTGGAILTVTVNLTAMVCHIVKKLVKLVVREMQIAPHLWQPIQI